MRTDAELRVNIVKGILENADLHRITDDYKKASADTKVAYLEGVISSLWVATHTK